MNFHILARSIVVAAVSLFSAAFLAAQIPAQIQDPSPDLIAAGEFPLAPSATIQTSNSGKLLVDLIIRGGLILTMDSARKIYDDGSVAIKGDSIVAVGPTAEIDEKYSSTKQIDATHMLVTP